MSTDDFKQTWAFASEVKEALGARYYDVQALPETFKSGRTKYLCTYLDSGRNVLAIHDCMMLLSKKTEKPYYVVRRTSRGGRTVAESKC